MQQKNKFPSKHWHIKCENRQITQNNSIYCEIYGTISKMRKFGHAFHIMSHLKKKQ